VDHDTGTTHHHDDTEAVLDVVRAAGGRITPPRRLLVDVLVADGRHRSAEEIAIEVQRVAPDVHLSTVYRNLDELERLGVVDSTRLGDGPTTYHLASATHGHFLCEHCGTMIEVPDAVFDSLATAAKRDYGFVIDPHRFAAVGRCRDCVEND
jgi:Fur family transcriptional regulator, ferric uptake regulator